jgi:hypothetical protein
MPHNNTNNTNSEAQDTYNGYDTGGYAQHYLQLRQRHHAAFESLHGISPFDLTKLLAVRCKAIAEDTEIPVVDLPKHQHLPQHERDRLNARRVDELLRLGDAMAEAWQAFIDNEPPGLYAIVVMQSRDRRRWKYGPQAHRVRVHHRAMGKAFMTTADPTCIGWRTWVEGVGPRGDSGVSNLLHIVPQLHGRDALQRLDLAALGVAST